MTWPTMRHGLLMGMGRHCPLRRLKRLAALAALALALCCAACIAARNATATAAEHRATEAWLRESRQKLGTAERDREMLLGVLNGGSLVETLPDGGRIYTRARLVRMGQR